VKPIHPNRSDFILWLRATRSGRTFPQYVFSADTDMPFYGQIAFTSLDGREIVRTSFTADELVDGLEGLHACLARTNTALGRDDLRHTRVLRFEEPLRPPDLSGHDLFLHHMQHPSRAIWQDPFDPEGEAVEDRRASLEAFIAAGGTILDYDPQTGRVE